MKICLKTKRKEEEKQRVELTISERLPTHIQSPCTLVCEYQVIPQDNYYVLQLALDGQLELTCQRCMQQFSYAYVHKTDIAVCNDEIIAEKILDQYESIVAPDYFVDLTEIITDELHLSVPQRHVIEEECDTEVSKYISVS